MTLLALKDSKLVCRIEFVFFILLSLCSDLFSAQTEIIFSAVGIPASTNLHSLFLDCNVSETPSNVAIHKKNPSSKHLVRKFNIRRASVEIKNQPMTNLFGEYECMATFTDRQRVTKIVNVSVDNFTPSFCKMTTNDQVINVTKDRAMAEFCVTSKERIERISINGDVLFDTVSVPLLPFDKFKLENTTYKSKTEFKLNLLHLTRESAKLYSVSIAYQTKIILEFRFSLFFPKERPILCDETSNNTDIATVTNMATAEVCVKPGDNISTIMINDAKIFDGRLLPSSHYTLISRTQDDTITFTFGVLNLTTSSTLKYVVKIVTATGLQLIYLFNVKVNPVTEISAKCFTTENATSLNVINNRVTISMCVNKTDTISTLAVNGLPITDRLSDQAPQYAIKNETHGQHTQFTIELSNLNKDISSNISLGVTSLVHNIEYYFDLSFPKEARSNWASSSATMLPPLLGKLMLTVIATVTVL